MPRQATYRALTLTIMLALASLTKLSSPALSEDLSTVFNKRGADSIATVDHSAFAKLLATYVKRSASGVNLVDYKGLKNEKKALNDYITSLTNIEITAHNPNEQFAFWANLYNALTLDVIVTHYPVATIRDIDISPGLFSNGPWGKKLIKVENKLLSLNDIEHKILRPIFKDPRVHYAVNCASFSCPNLMEKPFEGQMLDDQLTAAAKDYVNNNRAVKIKNGALYISKIYKWYKKDFGNNDKDVIAHINSYAAPELQDQLKSITKIAGHNYNWKLNEQSK